MKLRYHIASLLGCAFAMLLIHSRCKGPYELEYTNASGFVIGREVCKANDADDYWVVDLTVYPNTPQYGDTLTLNGVFYTNVVKLKGLDPRLKQVGMRVSIDFKDVTPDKVVTTGCAVAPSDTYALKELFIINQFEIR